MLGAAACWAAAPACPARAGTWLERRVVALNWAVLETLCAMEVRPLAGAELPGYRRAIGSPDLPPGIVDVGFQGAPNLEALSDLAPDLVFIQSWQAGMRDSLLRCAPVETLTIHTGEGDVYRRARMATRRIGECLDCRARSDDLVRRTDSALSRLRGRLTAHATRPVYIAQMISREGLSVFARGSLFDSVLERLGLRNAWGAAPDLLWGGTRIGLPSLAEVPDAALLLIASPSLAAQETLTGSALWRELPAVRQRRVARLPSIWAFGSLPTAERFGQFATEAILGLGAHG